MRTLSFGLRLHRATALLIGSSFLLVTTGCKSQKNNLPDGALSSSSNVTPAQPDTTGNAKVFLDIKDADTAATIFEKIKKFDAQKSTKTTLVWEGKAEMECQEQRFEKTTDTQCWMKVPNTKRDYIFNFGDVDAEIIFDLMKVDVKDFKVLEGVKSKSVTDNIKMISTKTEFSLSIVP